MEPCLKTDRNAYYREYWRTRRERRLAIQKAWRKRHPEVQRAYQERNREKLRAYLRNYVQIHKVEHNEACSRRRATEGRACPPWARKDPRIRAVYEIAAWLRSRGDDVQVDHIYPLRPKHHDDPVGLHVYENLQILSAQENRRKRNKQP
jgi:hypothetical protein